MEISVTSATAITALRVLMLYKLFAQKRLNHQFRPAGLNDPAIIFYSSLASPQLILFSIIRGGRDAEIVDFSVFTDAGLGFRRGSALRGSGCTGFWVGERAHS